MYVRSSQSHEERLIRLNFETLMKEIPAIGDSYRLTGSGRMVKKDQMGDGQKVQGRQGRGQDRRLAAEAVDGAAGGDPVAPARRQRASQGHTH